MVAPLAIGIGASLLGGIFGGGSEKNMQKIGQKYTKQWQESEYVKGATGSAQQLDVLGKYFNEYAPEWTAANVLSGHPIFSKYYNAQTAPVLASMLNAGITNVMKQRAGEMFSESGRLFSGLAGQYEGLLQGSMQLQAGGSEKDSQTWSNVFNNIGQMMSLAIGGGEDPGGGGLLSSAGGYAQGLAGMMGSMPSSPLSSIGWMFGG